MENNDPTPEPEPTGGEFIDYPDGPEPSESSGPGFFSTLFQDIFGSGDIGTRG